MQEKQYRFFIEVRDGQPVGFHKNVSCAIVFSFLPFVDCLAFNSLLTKKDGTTLTGNHIKYLSDALELFLLPLGCSYQRR